MKAFAFTGIFVLASFLACGGSSDSNGATTDGGTAASSSGAPGTSSSSSGNPAGDDDGGTGPIPGGDGGGVGPLVGSAPSCAQPNGGNTCGPNGTDDCCKSIAVPMPNNAFKLDKYNITAGRMRVFVESTGGNVRAWIQGHRPDWFEAGWDMYIPSEMDDGTIQTTTDHTYAEGKGYDGVYQQLGPIHYGVEGPGNEGCLTKEIGNARTYRIDDATNTKLFADVQQYPQDVLDKKPVQCVSFFMVAAFCAWDGGRLPTLAELDYAWDEGQPTKHLYPWGNTPAPGGWTDSFDNAADALAESKVNPKGSNQKVANYLYNFFEPAQRLCSDGATGTQCDYTLHVAPPGRFSPAGDGPFGHSDLAGNVYNVAMPMTGTAGTDPLAAKRTVGLAKTGAFDAHPIPTTHPVAPFSTWSPFSKYLAVGGRCARAM